jgi:C1A family cysteine protease
MQGSCGSCWSFGSTSSVESAYALASKSTPPLLSEQQLLDCAGWSCSGGRPSSALSFMAREKKGGVALASAYPYVAKQGKCLQDDAKSYGRVTKFSSIKGNDAALMQAILSYGSVTASVNARPLQLYSSGILTFEACKGFMADHVVNVVGWGSEVIAGKKSDYWIMRNSWSDAWGESAGRHYPGKLGYYRIERNGSNSCKIHSNLLAVESVAKL